jgi:hypothetical protein
VRYGWVIAAFIAALIFAVPALAGGLYWYTQSAWYNQGQSYDSVWDTCPQPYFGAGFLKGSNDYGTTAFIDNTGYNWHRTTSGYGDLSMGEPDYNYTKKGTSINNAGGQNVGYYGSADVEWTDTNCV